MIQPLQEKLSLLQKHLNDFSPEATATKLSLIKEIAAMPLSSKKDTLLYHNQLLFLQSYPENDTLLEVAHTEMKRLTDSVSNHPKLSEQLTGQGIYGTSIQGSYSLTLLKWMIHQKETEVQFHSFDLSGTHPKEVFRHCLSEAEFELTSDEKSSPEKWVEKAAGTKNKSEMVRWMVNVVAEMNCSEELKDQLFESLQLYVEVKSADTQFSKSYGRLPVKKYFFHPDGILKKFNEEELIRKKLPEKKKLDENQKKQIVAVSRYALALLIRETDPVTYSEELNIEYYELERGLSIALFSIDKNRRLPLESYIGFMMYKNGYPMSYGGAWLFGRRSLIGINIFEAFRGGESAIVFAQLLRCYHNAYGADYFEVEPYQFGKNNPEGIQSGAFWFYYRFGFRPLDEKLFLLASEEQKKIISTRGYRSPVEILKRFTGSNLFVHFSESKTKPVNPSDLSRYVTHVIAQKFAGNRSHARGWCLRELKRYKILSGKENKAGLNKLLFFFGICLDLSSLNTADKKLISKLTDMKITSEFEYALLLNRFSFEKHLSEGLKEFLS